MTSNKPTSSPVKSFTIQTLKATITLLEKAVAKLEAPPPAIPQPSLWSLLWESWLSVLNIIRSTLPAALNQKLSDGILTTILTTTLVLLVWASSNLLSNPPSEIAEIPPIENTPPSPPEPTPEVVEPTEPITEIPEIPLTPEQRLIASIETDITKATTEYAEGIINSIQANFRNSLLVVKLNDTWDTLTEQKQKKLAKEMFQKAKYLNFSRLEIIDNNNKMIARSPVVGEEMIILKNQSSSVN